MITGVLAAHGMNIVGARITTSRDGVALDVFRLSHAEATERVLDAGALGARAARRSRRCSRGQVDVEQLVAALAAAARSSTRRAMPTIPTVGDRRRQRGSRTTTRCSTSSRAGSRRRAVHDHQRALPPRLPHPPREDHDPVLHQVLDVFYVTDARGAEDSRPGGACRTICDSGDRRASRRGQRGMSGALVAAPAPRSATRARSLDRRYLAYLAAERGLSRNTVAAYARDLAAAAVVLARRAAGATPSAVATEDLVDVPRGRARARRSRPRARRAAWPRRCAASVRYPRVQRIASRRVRPGELDHARGSRAGCRSRRGRASDVRTPSRRAAPDTPARPRATARCSSCSTAPGCASPSSCALRLVAARTSTPTTCG